MSTIPNNQATIVGVSIGETLVNSLIRLSILGKETNQAVRDTIHHYIDHADDSDELDMLYKLVVLVGEAEGLYDQPDKPNTEDPK